MSAQEFLTTWTEAERTADTGHIAEILTGDFTAIGPLGYTLSKKDWLARHDSLKYEKLELANVTERSYGDVLVAIGTQTQEATYNGNPVPARNRVSIVLLRAEDTWKIANVHFSDQRSG
jgi:ketosteroid isomerase-like protein